MGELYPVHAIRLAPSPQRRLFSLAYLMVGIVCDPAQAVDSASQYK